MEQTLKNIALIIIIIGIFLGVRYVSSAIRYGCANVPLDNVPGGDDCPPPFVLAGRLGWLVTGDSWNPLWNRDATVVQKINWNIEKMYSSITIDITMRDGTSKRYDLGTAYGCTGETKNEIEDHKRYFGKVDCPLAPTKTKFVAFSQNYRFRIERYDRSAKDGSITTTVVMEI